MSYDLDWLENEEPEEKPMVRKNRTTEKKTSKKLVMPQEIKRLLERINRNLDKIWGYDNKIGREKERPKYRNLWEDWNALKEYIEEVSK